MDNQISRFRSSLFNGFNRNDVMAYIERSAKEQQAEKARFIEENSRLSKENEDLRRQIDLLRNTNSGLDSDQDGKTPDAATLPDYSELELAAYRRALAAEQAAIERAEKIQVRINNILKETFDDLNSIETDMETTAAHIVNQLQHLDSLCGALQENFENAGQLLCQLKDDNM